MALRVPPNSLFRHPVLGTLIIRFFFTVLAARPGRLVATSWWRDAQENADVGGHPESQHLVGLGLDFDGPEDELHAFEHRLQTLGISTVMELTHLHTQAFPAGFLSALGDTGEGELPPEARI